MCIINIAPYSVERYDPSKDAWEMVAPMADKRINFGVGVMLGFIFVVGGHNGVSHLSSIERYDPHQNQWTACRPMNEPRTGEFALCLTSKVSINFNLLVFDVCKRIVIVLQVWALLLWTTTSMWWEVTLGHPT